MPRKHRTTKQKLRRTLAIVIGLCLGWIVAGVLAGIAWLNRRAARALEAEIAALA